MSGVQKLSAAAQPADQWSAAAGRSLCAAVAMPPAAVTMMPVAVATLGANVASHVQCLDLLLCLGHLGCAWHEVVVCAQREPCVYAALQSLSWEMWTDGGGIQENLQHVQGLAVQTKGHGEKTGKGMGGCDEPPQEDLPFLDKQSP